MLTSVYVLCLDAYTKSLYVFLEFSRHPTGLGTDAFLSIDTYMQSFIGFQFFLTITV